MIAVVAVVLLAVWAFFNLRVEKTPAPILVRPVPKTVSEILIYGMVDTWGNRLKAKVDEASK